jgi:hypothetical protein
MTLGGPHAATRLGPQGGFLQGPFATISAGSLSPGPRQLWCHVELPTSLIGNMRPFTASQRVSAEHRF